MRLESKKFLFDILQSARLIEGFTRGQSFGDYINKPMLRSAVERQFEIMGEALGKLAKVDPATAERISGYRKIISFRNVLIHAYDAILDDVVWGVVETRLPDVLKTVEDLLAEGGS